MTLLERINTAIKEAMKAKDSTRVDTLRMVKSRIQEAEIAKRGTDEDKMSEDEVQAVILRYAKQVRESIEGFEKGGRAEQAEQAKAELVIVEEYVPAQMSDDDLKAIVKAAIKETGASSMRDMGNVMKEAMAKVGGQADGKRVSAIVKDLLG